MTEPTSSASLPRAMGLRDVVMFNITAIVGLRWVTTAARIGPLSIALWLVAMVAFFIPCAIVVARLAERDPGEGGIYRWVAAAYGEQHGFMAGWGYWVNNLVYYPSLLVTTAAIGAYALGPSGLHLADNPVYIAIFSLVVLWLALGMNILGLNVGKWVQNAGAFGTWLPALILVALAGWSLFKSGSASSFAPAAWAPKSFDYALLSFFATMAFGFAGLELAPVLGGEIHDAAKTIRRGIVVSGVMIVVMYVVGTAAVLVALPSGGVDITNGVPQAIAAIEGRLGTSGFAAVTAALLVVGNLGGVGAWLAGSARIPFVAGLDNRLPAAFGKVHPKYRSPYVAILTQGVIATVFVLTGLIGSSVQAAYLVLLDTTVILYFIPYVYMFLAYLKLERGAGSRLAAWLGLLTVILSIALSAIPAERPPSVWVFELKVWGGVFGFMAAGWWVSQRTARASRSMAT